MGLNIRKFKAVILSPLTVINMTLFVFAGASIYQLLSLDVILGQFYSINNQSGIYQSLIIICFILLVNVIYIITPSFNFIHNGIVIGKIINIILNSLVVVFFIVVIFLFNGKYGYLDYLVSVFSSGSLAESYIIMAEFGYDIINSGGLFFYTVLYFLPLYVFSFSFDEKNEFKRKLLVFLSFFLIAIYSMAGRREILLIIPLISVLSSKENNRFLLNVLIACVLFTTLAVFLLMARVKADGFDLSTYLDTQEFYPYTYGSYLAVEKISFFDTEEVKRLFPFYVITGDDNLSFYTRKEYFNYSDNGPTVTLLYPMLAFFPLSVFFLAAIFSQLKYLHRELVFKSKVSGPRVILYSYLMIKLFVLVRNGEFGLFFWDVLLFLLILSPVLFFKKKEII